MVISVTEAISMLQRIAPVLGEETIQLEDSVGRVLRRPAITEHDLPGFNRSAVDGYGIRSEDAHGQFRVLGSIHPGDAPGAAIEAGECRRIFTGAPLSPGINQVIQQELAILVGDKVTFTERPEESNIRLRGEDARIGDILVEAGELLSPAAVGTLAMMGISHPVVSRTLRLAHVVSGNELVGVSYAPSGSQIRDSNSPLVQAWLNRPGYKLLRQQRVADDLDQSLSIVQALLEQECDVLLFSGGASVGNRDYAATVFEKLDFKIHFREVNLRPGKPLIFASKDDVLAFGIPGNPASHVVCLELLIRMALEKMVGVKPTSRLAVAELEADFPQEAGPRETYWPASWKLVNQRLTISPLRWQSSGHLSSFVGANALLKLPAKSGPFKKGQSLEFLMI